MIIRELINLVGFKVNQSQLREAEKRVDGVVNKMRSAGMRMTMFFTLPFAGFVTAAVRAQGKQLQALAQVKKGIESTAQGAGRSIEQLTEQANKLQDETLFGNEEILQNMSAQFLTFTNITEERFDRLQVSALDLTARIWGVNANAESLRATAIQLGKALNDPVANLGALSRSGVQFTKQQKEVIKNLSETNRLAEAQELILTELEKQYGGSAKAAAEASLGFKQLWNDTGDLLKIWGNDLVPLMRRLTSWLRRVVSFLQEKMSPEMRIIILIIGGLISIIGPLLIGLSLMVVVGKAVTGMFLALRTAAWAANVPMAILLLKFILIAAAVALVSVAIILLIEDFIIWRKGGESAIGAVLNKFNELWEEFRKSHPVMSKFVDDWIWGFEEIGADLHKFMVRDWVPFWEKMGSVAFKANMKYREAMEGFAQATTDFVNEFWSINPESITQWFIDITNWIDRLMKKLEEFNVFDVIAEKVFKLDLSSTVRPAETAAGGLRGGPVITNQNEFNVTVPVTVSEGTPEHQKRVISDYTEDITETLFRKYLGKELRQATQAGSIME